jgi:glycerophosphoryl diester phosphodiesterase
VSSGSPELPPAFLAAPLAHRGLHDRGAGVIENSRAAVRAAVAAGYGIEIDIQRAGCGEAMVFHDATLKRLTGRRGLVAGHSAAELGGIELAGGGGETIPTLAEILALVDGRVALLIELKDSDAMLGPTSGVLETRAAELLAGYAGPVALMSFNPHSVAALARRAPDRPRGLTTCNFDGPDWPLPETRRGELAGISAFDDTGSAFVSHNHRELDSPAVASLKARGVPVLCWTVRRPAEEVAARRVADNITFEGYKPVHPG